MATIQDIQDYLAYDNALNADGGRGTMSRARSVINSLAGTQEGKARMEALSQDPDVIKYIQENSNKGGGFLGGLAGGIGNFIGEAGIKEGLALAGLATGIGALTGNPITAAGSQALGGETAANLAGYDPIAAMTGAGTGVSDAAALQAAMGGISSGLDGAGLGYADVAGMAPVAAGAAGAGAAGGAGGAGSVLGELTGLGGNTLGALISGGASLYGAQQGVNAANDATAEMRRQFDIGQANTAPWLAAGKNALGAQQDLMGLGSNGPEAQLNSLMNSPGYQFRLKQGQRGLDASSAARGGMGSGKAATSAMNWNQDYASNEYNNRLNQLAGLSGTGQTQANQNMQAGMSYAGDIGNSALMAGQMRQSGILGAAKAASDWMNPQPKQMTLADLFNGGRYGY